VKIRQNQAAVFASLCTDSIKGAIGELLKPCTYSEAFKSDAADVGCLHCGVLLSIEQSGT
jgi:hypothetical protein